MFIAVYFFLAETGSEPIEEMDRIFGGTVGSKDAALMNAIYARLGLDTEYNPKLVVMEGIIHDKEAGDA
ncbi:hypothetical protein V1511DRAFT_135054 [Dipodascopsis uninucleata]